MAAVGVLGDESCTESGESSASIGLGTREILVDTERFGGTEVAADRAPAVLSSLRRDTSSSTGCTVGGGGGSRVGGWRKVAWLEAFVLVDSFDLSSSRLELDLDIPDVLELGLS